MEQPDSPRPSPGDVVFGIGDLLDEILIRLEFPRFLVPALQVNRFWSSRATDPAFRRDFLERLASRPRPLGFYVGILDFFSSMSTQFVPMNQRPELPGVLGRSVKFGIVRDEPFPGPHTRVVCCRNGRVLVSVRLLLDGPYVVISPLTRTRMMFTIPPIQPPFAAGVKVFRFLRGGGDMPLCLFLGISFLFRNHGAMVRLCLLQDDTWVDRTSYASGFSASGQYLDKLLVHNRLYMLFSDGCIVRLDLESMRFFVIQLPDEIERITMVNLAIQTQLLSRADDSGVYLIEVSGTQLSVWLCKTRGDNPVSWVEDTFCLYEAFGDFARKIWTIEDKISSNGVAAHLFGAGDNAEFVFLVDSDSYGHVFYLNIRTRKVEPAYTTDGIHRQVLEICPFMMV